MQSSHLLAALTAFVAFFAPAPASAAPADWVRDSSGNAFLDQVELKDAPFCPAKVIAFDLEQTGTADIFDGVRLDDGPTVYECVYVSKSAGMRLWFQFYRPASGLPKTAGTMIEGPDQMFARDGFTELHQEATDSCAQSLEIVTRPGRYDETVLEDTSKVKPSNNVACLINLTYVKSSFVQFSAQRAGKWAIRITTYGDPRHMELATGVATILHAVQQPQPDWIRNLLRLDAIMPVD
jgi:hypothetical protein